MICGSPSGRLTPCTTVGTVSDFVGADRTTYDAPARTCLLRSSAVVKTPVHSSTRVDPEIAPRQRCRITFRERRDPTAVDDQRAIFCADLTVIAPVDGVVPDQVGEAVHVCDVR